MSTPSRAVVVRVEACEVCKWIIATTHWGRFGLTGECMHAFRVAAIDGRARIQPMQNGANAVVGVIMGSSSDWEVMKNATDILTRFGVEFEAKVVSAHRTPDDMFEYAETAADRGIRIIIAGAGGAAHLPGMIAAKTILPVLGVPVPSKYLRGEDSLLSIVQMPKGVPVATFAIGEAGAANAALFAIAMLAISSKALGQQLASFRDEQTAIARGMFVPPVMTEKH